MRHCLAPAMLVMALLLASCSKEAGKPVRSKDDSIPITTVAVQQSPLDQTIPVVGTLYAKDEATLGAEVEGRVEKTLVEFGDRIKAGQLLALIDTTTYEALAIQAAANLAKANANAANVELALKRTEQLYKDKIASQSDMDTALAEAQQSRASVKAAEATESVARLNLTRSNIKSPFDAVVAERIGNGGDFVKVGSPMFRIVNDAELKFVSQVPERYTSLVQSNQVVSFTVDAFPDEAFEGKVYLISPQINMTTRSFNIAALVSNATRKLKANTFARGDLVIKRNVNTTMIPLESIVSIAGITKVFLIDKETAKERKVTLGRIFNGKQEVVSGIRSGDVIAVTGCTKLYDGAKIKVKKDPNAN